MKARTRSTANLHLINYLPSRQKYQAFLRIEGKRLYVGTFSSRVDAFIAQNDFLFSLYGPLALARYFVSRPRKRNTVKIATKLSQLKAEYATCVESSIERPPPSSKVDIASLLSSLESHSDSERTKS